MGQSGAADVLSKFLAHAGVCSRRKAGDLVKAGSVTVNGHQILDPGHRVGDGDAVKVDGKIIKPESKVYLLLNKPKDCITTVSDEKERTTVLDVISGAPNVRLYPVGRLDRNTTGLLVMTNDGALAQLLSHPRYEVEKIYTATLSASLTRDHIAQIRRGVRLEDGVVKVDAIEPVMGTKSTVVSLALHSGKNRIVRRIFEHFGYEVEKLDRIGFAGLTKHGLTLGKWRELSSHEVAILRKSSSKR